MNILLGIHGDNENVNEIVNKFKMFDLELNVTPKFTKKGIYNELAVNKTIEKVILLENLEPSRPYTLSEIEELIDINDSLSFIFIVSQKHRNSEYIKELFSIGLYNIVFDDDSDIATLAYLLKHDRKKKEARIYYGIDSRGNEVKKVDAIDEVQIKRIIEYLCTEEEGTQLEKLTYMYNKLGEAKFIQIINSLPSELKTYIKSVPEFKSFIVDENKNLGINVVGNLKKTLSNINERTLSKLVKRIKDNKQETKENASSNKSLEEDRSKEIEEDEVKVQSYLNEVAVTKTMLEVKEVSPATESNDDGIDIMCDIDPYESDIKGREEEPDSNITDIKLVNESNELDSSTVEISIDNETNSSTPEIATEIYNHKNTLNHTDELYNHESPESDNLRNDKTKVSTKEKLESKNQKLSQLKAITIAGASRVKDSFSKKEDHSKEEDNSKNIQKKSQKIGEATTRVRSEVETSKPKVKDKKNKIELENLQVTIVIAFCSIIGGMGCSHISNSFAEIIKRVYKKKVAIIRLDENEKDITLDGIPIYSLKDFTRVFSSYDFIMLDVGTYKEEIKEIEMSNIKIMCCNYQKPIVQKLASFIKEQENPYKWRYVFNHTTKKNENAIHDLMEDYQHICFPVHEIGVKNTALEDDIGIMLRGGKF